MTAALPAEEAMLVNRRFAVRFLGRRGAWLWLVGTGVFSVGAWLAIALPARGTASAERTWYLWSGNVLLVLFIATMVFVARKWSIKLPYFRDFGRAPAERADACWGAIQELNTKIRKGAFGSDAEIQTAAAETLKRFGVDRIQRVELRVLNVGAAPVKYLQLVKKEPFGRLEPWLEMHMGVGTIACLAVLLHADFALRHPVGWMLFTGSMIVLATGLLGAVLYRVIPTRLAKADCGIPYEEAGVARENCQLCVDGILESIDESVRPILTPLATPAASPQELRERSRNILSQVIAKNPALAETARDLVVMAGARDELLWSTATARRYDFWLRLWRWIHVPVSVALFFVIALHVWAVLWY